MHSGNYVRAEKFKKIYVEITNVCNLTCDFCPRTKRTPEFMSTETFRAILDRLAGYTGYLYLHVKGEPLLHPQLSEFLDICSEKGFQVNITTNGTLIRESGNMLLSKPAVRQVNFSLQSFDGNQSHLAKSHLAKSHLAKSHLAKSEYIGSILSFAKEAMEKTLMFVSLRLWNLHKDKSEKRQNDEILTIIEDAFHLSSPICEDEKSGRGIGGGGAKDRANNSRGIKITERLYVNQATEFVWPDLKEKEDCGSAFCYGLRNQAAILVDGTVVPCCLDGEGVINLGNILTTPFSEIIESDRARNIVDGFTRKEAAEELCRKCGYRTRF